MKQKLFCLALALMLAVCSFSVAQTAATATSPIRLGGSGDESLMGLLPLSNGDLLISLCGHGGFDGLADTTRFNVRKTQLICLAPDGAQRWMADFGEETGYTSFIQLAENTDGTVTGTLKHSLNQSDVFFQVQTRSLKDGALISSGEKVDLTTKNRNIYLTVYPMGGSTLTQETHDAQASCEPRYAVLTDESGAEQWRVDVRDIGMTYIESAHAVSDGVILCGNLWNSALNREQLVILKLDAAGKQRWRYCPEELPDAGYGSSLIGTEGRLVCTAFIRNPLEIDDKGRVTGDNALSLSMYLCMDVDSGDMIWRHFYPTENASFRGGKLNQQEGFYLLMGRSAFAVLDRDGYLHGGWASPDDHDYIGSSFFLWGGQQWLESMIMDADNTMDVLLERLDIPDEAVIATALEPVELSAALNAAAKSTLPPTEGQTPEGTSIPEAAPEAERTEAEQYALDELVRAKTAEWEKKLGFNGLWPLEKKVEFYQTYGSQPSHYSTIEIPMAMPEETDVKLEDAISYAKQLLRDKFELTDDEIEAFQIGAEFNTDGSYPISGSQRAWILSFYTAEADETGELHGNYCAYIPSPGGDAQLLSNPSVKQLMSWGCSEEAASMLTELGGVCYNPDGGKYFHIDSECASISPEYRGNLVFFETGLLPTSRYNHLKPCPVCLP